MRYKKALCTVVSFTPGNFQLMNQNDFSPSDLLVVSKILDFTQDDSLKPLFQTIYGTYFIKNLSPSIKHEQ